MKSTVSAVFTERSSYEHGYWNTCLRGGSTNWNSCGIVESGPLDPKSSGNESIGIDLTGKSKNQKKNLVFLRERAHRSWKFLKFWKIRKNENLKKYVAFFEFFKIKIQKSKVWILRGMNMSDPNGTGFENPVCSPPILIPPPKCDLKLREHYTRIEGRD